MNTKFQEPAGAAGARGTGGRQRLIDAALDLASTTSSLASLGLREVTRCAGLAPNSFYRHFRSFDDLGLAALEMMGSKLRQGLRERRRQGAGGARVTIRSLDELLAGSQALIRDTVGLVLDYVAEHPTAWIVGMRELYGSSPVMRRAVQQMLEDFGQDMAEDIQMVIDFPGLSAAALRDISRQVARQMMSFSMDYIEHPQRRDDIRNQAERFILRMFAGELALATATAASPKPRRAGKAPPRGARAR